MLHKEPNIAVNITIDTEEGWQVDQEIIAQIWTGKLQMN